LRSIKAACYNRYDYLFYFIVTTKIYFSLWQKRNIVLMFVLILLAQTFLPLQSHTRVVLTDTGRVVVLCTLQGYQTVQFDEQGRITGKQYQSQAQTSAAVKFSQLLSYATPVLPIFDLASSDVDNFHFSETHQPVLKTDTGWYFSIRAPPLQA